MTNVRNVDDDRRLDSLCKVYLLKASRSLCILAANKFQMATAEPIWYASLPAHWRTYTSPAWWGFTSANDWRHLEAFMHHSATLGYRSDSNLTFDSICTIADEKLFSASLATVIISCINFFPRNVNNIIPSVIAHTTSNFLLAHPA